MTVKPSLASYDVRSSWDALGDTHGIPVHILGIC